ncbi:secretory calcium-binding phosphoprotein 9 [Genypterus blacodes]|uniref:secretory calcium-binding phosphoprotein 9 n=1 Tax=Genypterus blacodes TaxID=154954 RepID=UPI003F757FCB
MNGGMVNGINPAMMAGGLNPVMVAGGGGLFGQPQFAQAYPGFRGFPMQAPVPNMFPAPAVNALPYMPAPQMTGMNPFRQPFMVLPGGGMQQPDLIQRFKRHIMNEANTLQTTVDTQIPAPIEVTTTAPCSEEHQDE